MAGWDPERIALVTAKLADGTLSAERVATGYFVTGDLVLTVRHVSEQPGSVFEVRSGLTGSEEDQWTEAEPVWEGIGDLDAMLLRTKKQFGDWDPPSFSPTGDSGAWQSSGYARGAVDEQRENRKTLPLEGTFGVSRGQGSPELALTTQQIVASGKNYYWQGLSGSPVFAKGALTDQLIGIITDASSAMANLFTALPAVRLLDDIRFQSAITRPFLQLPDQPYCIVLTSEHSTYDLLGQVDGVLGGHIEETPFSELHEKPIEIPVLEAIASVGNWAATVKALAQATFLVADVTSFEPAVMLLLGVRSVVRRGVTVSVSEDNLNGDDGADLERSTPPAKVPFNVQETRVLWFNDDNFDERLYRAMRDGQEHLTNDPNYLDLPAYHAVRAPRPRSWAEEDERSFVVLCPFSPKYSHFYRKTVRSIIQAYTRNRRPLRMLDLRSPRLVGQALYEQIRWASLCLVDWTGWRANVFFELGVRLACSEHDPLCIVEKGDPESTATVGPSLVLKQQDLLRKLFGPVEYDADMPRPALKEPLQSWSLLKRSGMALSTRAGALPPAATYVSAHESFVWINDPMLVQPNVDQRERAERIVGEDPEKRPERLVLFSENKGFNAELRAAVREQWISAWLYLQHLQAGGEVSVDRSKEFREVTSRLDYMLSTSQEPRHKQLRSEIRRLRKAERDERRGRAGGTSD